MKTVLGPNLRLRLIEVADAEYVHRLRTNASYNKHLSPVTGSVQVQAAWIIRYKLREAAGQEFYFIIERHDGIRCGTVRLYEISSAQFTWGSWILDQNKTRKAALESAILSFEFGFHELNLERALISVRIENQKALRIYNWMGMTEIGRDERNIYFIY